MSKVQELDQAVGDVNVVVLRGWLSSKPVERELSSGSVVWSYEVTTREGGGTCTAPVSWLDPSRVPQLAAGAAVVVVGRVKRRFFRGGGGTQSRTEVAADAVVPANRPAQVRAALARAQEALTLR